MKNVQIPLDIIFIRDSAIQNIETVDGCSSDSCSLVSSGEIVDQVLEVPAGTAEALGLRTNDEIKIIVLEE